LTVDLFMDVSTLLSTYALGYDTQDPAMVAACFAPDGVFEILLPDGTTLTYTGRPAIEAFMQEQLNGQDDHRRHFTTNLRLISSGPDAARVGCYLLLGALSQGKLSIVQSGRYDDQIIWADGAPLFKHRYLVMDGTF
jgi:hypothetical protein